MVQPDKHGHLWTLPDGTGLHAPPGILVAEFATGRLCCHLCGQWFAALGVHVRVHGHTAGSYREATGLPPGRVLASPDVSESIRAGRARGARMRAESALERHRVDPAGDRWPETGQPFVNRTARFRGWTVIGRRAARDNSQAGLAS